MCWSLANSMEFVIFKDLDFTHLLKLIYVPVTSFVGEHVRSILFHANRIK
jgi:hypothetical protein